MTESKGPLSEIAELIKDIRIATLTTRDDQGKLRSRPMGTQDADFEGTLWFLTYDDSPKTAEIEAHSDVNISYSDPGSQRFVSISGRARVSNDRKMINELWNPALKAWFPKGQDDPHIAVIEVEAEEAEYWDSPSSTFVKAAGFAKAALTGKPYLPGDNKKVNLETGETVDAKEQNKQRSERDSAA